MIEDNNLFKRYVFQNIYYLEILYEIHQICFATRNFKLLFNYTRNY